MFNPKFDALYKFDEVSGCRYIDEVELSKEYIKNCNILTEIFKDDCGDKDYKPGMLAWIQLYTEYLLSQQEETPDYYNDGEEDADDGFYEEEDEESYIERCKQDYLDDNH